MTASLVFESLSFDYDRQPIQERLAFDSLRFDCDDDAKERERQSPDPAKSPFPMVLSRAVRLPEVCLDPLRYPLADLALSLRISYP